MISEGTRRFTRPTTAVTPLLVLLPLLLQAPPVVAQAGYVQNNLVSDQPGVATFTDPNLVNAWGLASSGASPFWVANNGTGTATLYNTLGKPQVLIVSVPAPGGGAAAPTGQVFNGTADFVVTGAGSGASRFIFSTEDGTINAWGPGVTGTTAIVAADHSAAGAIYKGLALANNGSGNFLYAPDFANARIDVFNSTFGDATLTGSFVDPTAPVGYAPFNVQNLGGDLYVTFAKQQAGSTDEAHGDGFGFVSVFDANGNFLRRVASGVDVGGTLTDLNAPWGLALRPNDGLRRIQRRPAGRQLWKRPHPSPSTRSRDAFKGVMTDALGEYRSLSTACGACGYGNGGNGRSDEQNLLQAPARAMKAHGLFGSLKSAAPEPETLPFLLLGAPLLGLAIAARWRRAANVSA